ncbi:MAG: patatin family protein [Oscillospiraceae bacterium]|nr:patatin family protein [Oscillospiraceae bacterium]
MKKGLILEGGAMRGMFTAGVLDVMMEQGIELDGAVGVSAGACFGCNYKSCQIGRAIRYNMRFCGDKRYCSLYSLVTSGNLYNTDFCYTEVPLIHDPFDFDTYQTNPMEFYVVCTDIERGVPVYRKYEGFEDHGFDWIRASASMPMVSEIVEIEGMKLLDGGVADSIPVKFMESLGYDRNIAVLTQPKIYFKKKNEMMPLIRMKYRHYPKLVELLENRHRVYNETLAYISQQERAGKLLVIRPDAKLPVARTEKNPAKLKKAYDIGRRIAEERMDEILAYLG